MCTEPNEVRLLDEFQGAKKRLQKIREEIPIDNEDFGYARSLLQDEIDGVNFASEILINVSRLDSEINRLRLQLEGTTNENRWLREELNRVRKQVRESECEKVELEVKLDDLKYRLEMAECEKKATLVASSYSKQSTSDSSCALSNRGDSYSLKSDEYRLDKSCAENRNIPANMKHVYNIVINYINQGHSDVALVLAKQLVTEMEEHIGPNCSEVGTLLNFMAQIYRDKNNLQDATIALRKALDIKEKIYGSDNPTVAAILNNLSVLYGKQGLYTDAHILCNKALEIRRKIYGKEHPDIAKQLTNLALIHGNLEKFKEAEENYREAINI